jgi:hypothetical protein
MYRISGGLLRTFARGSPRSFSDVKGLAILNADDVHPAAFRLFPNVATLLLCNCDKNTNYYWGDDIMFPKLKTLMIDGHPCEPPFAQRLVERTKTRDLHLTISSAYLSDWARYCGHDLGNVNVREPRFFRTRLDDFPNQFREEPPW